MKLKENIFLLDGIGAIITALSHGFMLPFFKEYVGMPTNVLYPLAFIALGFAIFSLTNHVLKSKNFSKNLRIIAVANILFCITTVILMIVFRDVIKPLGYVYFIVEILIVIPLALLEFRIAKEN